MLNKHYQNGLVFQAIIAVLTPVPEHQSQQNLK